MRENFDGRVPAWLMCSKPEIGGLSSLRYIMWNGILVHKCGEPGLALLNKISALVQQLIIARVLTKNNQ